MGGDGGDGGLAATVLGRKLLQTFKTTGGNGGAGGAAANFAPVTGGNGGAGEQIFDLENCIWSQHAVYVFDGRLAASILLIKEAASDT